MGLPPSPFRITAIAIEGNDVRITWECDSSNTYFLRASDNLTGTYSIVASIVITNNSVVCTNGTVVISAPTITNLVEVGGATNSPSRFYRVSRTDPDPA